MNELREQAWVAWNEPDPLTKCTQTRAAAATIRPMALDVERRWYNPPNVPGRPALPLLLPPSAVPRRGTGSAAGRASLLHAVAHIEFNAINLALDAVWRFPCMPTDFYSDWLCVAAEEATHFLLLVERLAAYGLRYGDKPAHDGLWEAAYKTRDDALARMALVPRTLEARGLDVTPAMRDKLAEAGDQASAAVLDLILREEVGHVAVGDRWYRFLCKQQKRDALTTHADLARIYQVGLPHPPFNCDARVRAGFTMDDLAYFEGLQPKP